MKEDIKSMTLEELTGALARLGEPAFRGKQIFSWLHRGAASFEEMSNLSKPLREKLAGLYYIDALQVERKQVSRLDGTVKYLWRLMDGNCIETVLMQYHHGNTVCISSQVGCRMGCAFCASTIGGKVRDLRPSELLDQVIFTQLDSGLSVSNIVLMGIGEPLDNLDNVLRFLELVNHPDAPYQSLHLWHPAGNPPPGGGGTAVDTQRIPSCAGQRDPQQDHAGEPGVRCGGFVCGLPRLLSKDRAAHQL